MPKLFFASARSSAGGHLMREYGVDSFDAKAFELIGGKRAYIYSETAIRLASYLRRPWRSLSGPGHVLVSIARSWERSNSAQTLPLDWPHRGMYAAKRG